MICSHKGCNGNLIEQKPEKGRSLVFECSKCHCIFALTTVRCNVKCPALKSSYPKDINETMPKKRGRKLKVKKS